jgi:hypothetical protein
MHNDTNKGEEICIIDGKYKKHNGWHWAGKDDTPKFTHVIVLLENGQELGTKVKKGNVRRLMPPPNYVEVALQQHLDIDCALHKVCKLLAKCHLTAGHEEAAQHVFMKRMETAIRQQAADDKICMMTTRLACNRAIESSYWRMDSDSDVGLLTSYVLYRLLVELEFMDLDTFPR